MIQIISKGIMMYLLIGVVTLILCIILGVIESILNSFKNTKFIIKCHKLIKKDYDIKEIFCNELKFSLEEVKDYLKYFALVQILLYPMLIVQLFLPEDFKEECLENGQQIIDNWRKNED